MPIRLNLTSRVVTMNTQPLHALVAPVADSYPTFWTHESHHPHPPTAPTPPDEAYSAFVNLTEDELPETDLEHALEDVTFHPDL